MSKNNSFSHAPELTEKEIYHQTHPIKLLIVGDSESGKNLLVDNYRGEF